MLQRLWPCFELLTMEFLTAKVNRNEDQIWPKKKMEKGNKTDHKMTRDNNINQRLQQSGTRCRRTSSLKFLRTCQPIDRFQSDMLHRSNGARRRLGGQKATFLCRLDGVLTDLCSSSWTFSSERCFCAAFSGSKWSGAFSGGVAAVVKDFCSFSWIEPSRFFTGFADRRSGHQRHDIWTPQPPLPLLLSTVMSLELLYCSGIAVSDNCFCEHADRCQFLKRLPGASEEERQREREREREERETVTEFEWVRERERERERDRQTDRQAEGERERASHLDQKKIVQRSPNADRSWLSSLKTLEHTMIPQWSSVITWRWAHLSCTLFCILINCQYVCQEVRKLKNHAPIFLIFTIKKENTWTIKHITHTHTSQLQAHMWHARAHTYVHIHEHTHTHTHTHPRLTHACVHIRTVIYKFHLQQNVRFFFFNFWHYHPAKITILPRKLREANNVEICMDFFFFSNKKFILSNWTSMEQKALLTTQFCVVFKILNIHSTSPDFDWIFFLAKVREKRERGEKKDIRVRYM